MISQLFINLPVKDLDKTVAFFTKLGFTFNPQFTDKNATCMIINDDTFAMLLVEPYFKTFIRKEVADATKTAEVITAMSLESKEKVDSMMQAALAAGATESKDTQDLGFMYQRGFQDVDGHLWEIFWMDISKMPASE